MLLYSIYVVPFVVSIYTIVKANGMWPVVGGGLEEHSCLKTWLRWWIFTLIWDFQKMYMQKTLQNMRVLVPCWQIWIWQPLHSISIFSHVCNFCLYVCVHILHVCAYLSICVYTIRYVCIPVHVSVPICQIRCVWAVRGSWDEGEPDESSEALSLPHGCSHSCSPRTGSWESSRDRGDWARGQDTPLPGEVKEHMSSLLGITYTREMGFTASCFSLTRFGTKEPDSPSLVCAGQEFSPGCNQGNSDYSDRYWSTSGNIDEGDYIFK